MKFKIGLEMPMIRELILELLLQLIQEIPQETFCQERTLKIL